MRKEEGSMAENGTWTEERVLASDVWNADKSLGPMSPEEEVEAQNGQYAR